MTSRRTALAKARENRRPSRLGTFAGTAPTPDYDVAPDAGFPRLLSQAWATAARAETPREGAAVLLTLDGRVPLDVRLRALGADAEAAVAALWNLSWRGPHASERTPTGPDSPDGQTVFSGELALGTDGRVLLRTPSQPSLATDHQLVGGVIRVPWSPRALAEYQFEVLRAANQQTRSVADCRSWLTTVGVDGRAELLARLRDAAQRTAPFVLYQDDLTYTNFRGANTLTGKTLWPGHPDCALTGLEDRPVNLWSDHEVTLVVCLALLIESSSYARIEEANGTQLTIHHVSHLLDRTRLNYNTVGGADEIAPSPSTRVSDLHDLAGALRRRRLIIAPRIQLYREIHGALMHKVERIAGSLDRRSQQRLDALAGRLQKRLPVLGTTLDALSDDIEADPAWLAQPCGTFATGLEALVFETVAACTDVFCADFAMSRGIRSLPKLIDSLRREEYQEICSWEIKDFFCCVVPARDAERHFNGSINQLADTAWAISSRMQYNSWHFIAGGLPPTPDVLGRDYFVPPTIPDIAFYSDQHHHGHVAAKVRWSIRSPQPVHVLDRTFNGFIDVRLLRNDGDPFNEQDLLATHRVSRFIAHATTVAARLAAAGAHLEVTSFTSPWHWETTTGQPAAPAGGNPPA